MIATDARAQANPHPFSPSLKFASCAVSDCVWLRSRRLQRRPAPAVPASFEFWSPAVVKNPPFSAMQKVRHQVVADQGNAERHCQPNVNDIATQVLTHAPVNDTIFRWS